MSKVILKVEVEEDYLGSIKASTNKTSSDIILINATPLTESDDAVSRQAVNDLYDRYHPRLATHVYEFGEDLKALPSVLPKREQGEWIEVHPLQEDDGGAYMCSKCRCGHPYIAPHWKYCPNCGAEMR